MSESPTVKPDEKQAALEEVLKSAPFVRSDQLRNFLKYVCQMELAGRGDELNEYLIGVEALGKPPGYSTAEDAAVRRRAHELREKLDEAYAADLAGARLRIELPKGRYVPRFVPHEPEAAPPPAPVLAARPPRFGWLPPLAFMAAGALLATLGSRLTAKRHVAAILDPVLREAWAPFVAPGSSVTLAVASPAHFNILPYPEGPLPPGVRVLPAEWDLATWYQNHYPLPPGHRLGLHLSGPLRSGEVLGMLTAVRVLTRANADVQVIVEKKLPLSAIRGRNLIFFANPEYSELAHALLARAIWTVDYDPAGRARVVRPQDGAPPQHKTFTPGAEWQRRATFGLLTVLPNAESVVPGQAPAATLARTVLVSCTNSQGCQAAMDFFASPNSMSALRDRFRAEGLSGFPPAYQVVVRCDLHLSQPVAGAYEAHAVVPSP